MNKNKIKLLGLFLGKQAVELPPELQQERDSLYQAQQEELQQEMESKKKKLLAKRLKEDNALKENAVQMATKQHLDAEKQRAKELQKQQKEQQKAQQEAEKLQQNAGGLGSQGLGGAGRMPGAVNPFAPQKTASDKNSAEILKSYYKKFKGL